MMKVVSYFSEIFRVESYCNESSESTMELSKASAIDFRWEIQISYLAANYIAIMEITPTTRVSNLSTNWDKRAPAVLSIECEWLELHSFHFSPESRERRSFSLSVMKLVPLTRLMNVIRARDIVKCSSDCFRRFRRVRTSKATRVRNKFL